MPPKVKITKEDILAAALQITRQSGISALNARTVAAALGCSTQPVFSNFATMEHLQKAVMEKATNLCDEYLQREVASGQFPIYKANGMAYIRFAKEETEFFKLLFMYDRDGAPIPEDAELKTRMEAIVRSNTGLSPEEVQLFHLEMWAFVHGIATMFATGYLNLPWELVSQMLSDAYMGLRKQYGMG